jgi:DNA-binding beta-propeller fold protein YncE
VYRTVGGDVGMLLWICRVLVLGLPVLLLIVSGLARAAPPAPSGQIFAAEECHHRLVRINDMTGAGWVTLGSPGEGVNQFTYPQGIFVSPTGQIYVADTGTHFRVVQGINRIVRVDDIAGKGWTTFGTDGSGVNQFTEPRGVFVNASGQIYVADSYNSRIVRINDMTGAGWTTFGSYGKEINHFDLPRSVVVSRSGQIYVADAGNSRVVRIDNMTGAGWITFGTLGQGINQFVQITDMYVTPTGQIYVADFYKGIIRINDMTGVGWTTLGGFNSGVVSVFVNPIGQIFVGEYSSITRVDDMTGAGRITFAPGTGKTVGESLCGAHVSVR